MMGVTEEEVNGVQKDATPDMRILGFEDEERRRLRLKKLSSTSIKLPQGPYIFCGFRTLQLPGVEVSHYDPLSFFLLKVDEVNVYHLEFKVTP